MYQPLERVCGERVGSRDAVLCTDYDKKGLPQKEGVMMFPKVPDNL